ncbi:MAG: hypothetical protein LBH06_05800 [Rikenellaceae bacterium]|jgi:hypothetical protein|nr:hypothetical protein [Rikenellaceae bacterium]
MMAFEDTESFEYQRTGRCMIFFTSTSADYFASASRFTTKEMAWLSEGSTVMSMRIGMLIWHPLANLNNSLEQPELVAIWEGVLSLYLASAAMCRPGGPATRNQHIFLVPGLHCRMKFL